MRTSDTRYFTDPSIIAAALGLGPGDMVRDPRSFGNFFETMAIRDLRCYADALGAEVSHYLDANAWMSIGSICRHGHAGRVTLPWAVECCKVELVGARVPRVRVEKEQ